MNSNIGQFDESVLGVAIFGFVRCGRFRLLSQRNHLGHRPHALVELVELANAEVGPPGIYVMLNRKEAAVGAGSAVPDSYQEIDVVFWQYDPVLALESPDRGRCLRREQPISETSKFLFDPLDVMATSPDGIGTRIPAFLKPVRKAKTKTIVVWFCLDFFSERSFVVQHERPHIIAWFRDTQRAGGISEGVEPTSVMLYCPG
jgi:hypothetical protein